MKRKLRYHSTDFISSMEALTILNLKLPETNKNGNKTKQPTMYLAGLVESGYLSRSVVTKKTIEYLRSEVLELYSRSKVEGINLRLKPFKKSKAA